MWLYESTSRLQVNQCFFIKIEVTPVGERNQNAYATNAPDSDPKARFAFWVSLWDGEGQGVFWGYAQSYMASNRHREFSCVWFERKRRFVFVDKRVKDTPSELQPLLMGPTGMSR